MYPEVVAVTPGTSVEIPFDAPEAAAAKLAVAGLGQRNPCLAHEADGEDQKPNSDVGNTHATALTAIDFGNNGQTGRWRQAMRSRSTPTPCRRGDL